MALIAFALLVGCGTPGYIRADAIEDTLMGVMERHDFYVSSDPDLSDLSKRVSLRDTELLRRLLEEAQDPEAAEAVAAITSEAQ